MSEKARIVVVLVPAIVCWVQGSTSCWWGGAGAGLYPQHRQSLPLGGQLVGCVWGGAYHGGGRTLVMCFPARYR